MYNKSSQKRLQWANYSCTQRFDGTHIKHLRLNQSQIDQSDIEIHSLFLQLFFINVVFKFNIWIFVIKKLVTNISAENMEQEAFSLQAG